MIGCLWLILMSVSDAIQPCPHGGVAGWPVGVVAGGPAGGVAGGPAGGVPAWWACG